MTIGRYQQSVSLIMLLLCWSQLAAQGVNPYMKPFFFSGSMDKNKKNWSTKKIPVTGTATYTSPVNGEKITGNFEKGHLNGAFTLHDKAGNLMLEGDARMDSIILGTQYQPMTLYKGIFDSLTGTWINNMMMPIFTGHWKNNKWHSGRYYENVNYGTGLPYCLTYTDAGFDENGYPKENIYTYALKKYPTDMTYYPYAYIEKPGTLKYYYRADGSLKETELWDIHKSQLYRETYYPEPENKEGIAYLQNPLGTRMPGGAFKGFAFSYPDGSFSFDIRGWLHTQYKDGHCRKTLYGHDGKPVPGIQWDLPVLTPGVRPDSVNYADIYWNNKRYKGGVLQGKPNGWGRYFIEENQVLEGYFKEGVPIGYAAALNDYTDSRKYFAVYKDGQLNTQYKVLDDVAMAAAQKKIYDEQKRQEAERERLSRPAPLPGPKRVVSWSVSEGYAKWSDHTVTYGTDINWKMVKPGMVMMHNNRVQVVQLPPSITNRMIFFYGVGKAHEYTVSQGWETVRIYPELESLKTSFVGTCNFCYGSGIYTGYVKNKEGNISKVYLGTKQIQHNVYDIYGPITTKGTCSACSGTGLGAKN